MTGRTLNPLPGLFVGVMSGTSLDGITVALARFSPRIAGGRAAPGTHAECIAVRHHPYDATERGRLEAAMSGVSAREYALLGVDLAAWSARAIDALLADARVAHTDVAAIGFHGQTIWHEPGIATWQLGQPAVIAEALGIPVVHDFRARDVAAGGQGAPLVAIADRDCFAADDAWRVLLNVGGIANVTVVPPAGERGDVRAFDTGPGVLAIDAFARAVDPALPYDIDGQLARSGTPVHAAIDATLGDPWFRTPPPRSTGRERFSSAWIDAFAARIRELAPASRGADLVATAAHLTARAIARALRQFVTEPIGDVVIAGGGARHPVLVEALAEQLPVPVRHFDALFFDGEAKEAVAFAYLAALHVANRVGNVPSATGSRGPRILGSMVPGR